MSRDGMGRDDGASWGVERGWDAMGCDAMRWDGWKQMW